jgi:hypothetical protein
VNKSFQLPQAWQYFFLGVLLWALVDFGTAGGFRISYFQTYGPTLLLFYIGYPWIFSILIFKLHWNEHRLFLATLLAIFVVEVLFTRNPLVMTFPAMLLGIPLAILVYAPLTYFPLWFVRKEMTRHRILITGLIIVELIVMMVTTFGNSGS